MTDKQIIIDGVDVSGCEFYTNGWCCCALLYEEHCKDCSYCMYKLKRQLKAKEQECEELKEKVKKYGEINEQETKDYAELKAENEQLKNFHINLVGVKECEIRELAELKSDNKHLNDLLNQALKELEESRGAIEKIKEITELEAENRSLKAYIKILENNNEVNKCENQ